MSKQFIFIDTCMFREWKTVHIEQNLKQIQDKFHIVIPSVQLHELEKHLLARWSTFEDRTIEDKMSNFLADNPEHKDKAVIDKKIEKLKQAYNDLNQKIEEIKREECSNIIDFLKQQLIISPSIEDYLGAKNRVHSEIAPYTKKEQDNHRHYDSLHWEILLNSKEIPEGSTLYIYTKDKGFFRNNTHNMGLHPLLIQEWSILKKGELKLYMHTEGDKKFCQKEAQEDFSEMQQETYPSFYVDRVLEAQDPWNFPSTSEVYVPIYKLINSIHDAMKRSSDFETEKLFEELFYRIKTAQRIGYFSYPYDTVLNEAHRLYGKYRSMK